MTLLNIKNYLKQKQNLLNFLSFFVLISSLIFFFDGNLLEFKNNELFSNALNVHVKILQNIIFGFLFLNLFLNFKYYYIGFIAPFAFLEQIYNFFGFYVHPLLLNLGFYDLFSESPENISPEYPRIILFFCILVTSFILLSFKKWRNFKRIFLCFGALGVFLTALLFHSVIIYEMNAFKKFEKDAMFNIFARSDNKFNFAKNCSINNYKCFYFELNQLDDIFNNKEVPSFVTNTLTFVKPYYEKNETFFYYSIAYDPNNNNRLLGQLTFSLIKNKNFGAVIINGGTLKDFFIINQLVFVALAWASHLVWFFGSLFLIWFHEKRFQKKKI